MAEAGMSNQTAQYRLRKHLHFDALIRLVRERFEKIPDSRRCPLYSLPDTLMAGLAMFSLKDPSLLAFQSRVRDGNLASIFGLKVIPSDSQEREVLDEVDSPHLRPLFTDIFRQSQRGKVLEDYLYLEGCYLIALDGVEYFGSKTVHCDHCMTRNHKNGEVSYYHQLLGAVIVHPDISCVIPLCPEPIQRQDGATKNDCERNAARRWLTQFRREHPHLPVIITEDGLSSNGPHIQDLKDADCHFILGVKPGDHAYLFEQLAERAEVGDVKTWEVTDPKTKISQSYLCVNGVSLNETHEDLLVDVLHYVEVDADGVEHKWTWVTDLELTVEKAPKVMRGGRSRWKVENETFNTLKNQGYHFEHNYGHGYKNLCVNFAMLMMLAFLIDQIQQRSNKLFEKAREKTGSKKSLWEAIRHLFYSFVVGSMAAIYEAIAFGYERPELETLIEQKRATRLGVDTS
jgi:hypothetical protein